MPGSSPQVLSLSNSTTVQRAKPLLGTLVVIRVRTTADLAFDSYLNRIYAPVDNAFLAIQNIANAMSAHHPDSDLARIARAQPGAVLTLSPHTVAVLRLAKYWYTTSLGAFDPVKAADSLAARGMRPAFSGVALAARASLRDVQVLGDDQVRLVRPLRLDLGGIAKGYAVDQAVAVLNAQGLTTVLVNAGGDMRATGAWDWPVVLRHAEHPTHTHRARGLRALRNAALASSTAAPLNVEFVGTARTSRTRQPWLWASCTVRASDCVTADALTKWGLQSAPGSPRLARVLRQHRATLWRS